MATACQEAVPESDDEGPRSGARPSARQAQDCPCVVSSDDEGAAPRQWQQWEGWAAPAAADGPADALRQLNGQHPLPPARQQSGKVFARRAAAPRPAAFARGGSSRGAGGAAGFRRPMKTAEAAQADHAAAERAAAEEAELAAALTGSTAVPAGEGGDQQELGGLGGLDWMQGGQAQGEPLPLLSHQQQPAAAAAAAARPAGRSDGPTFVNRRVLPRAPSRAEQAQQAQQQHGGGRSAEAGEAGSPAADEAAAGPAAARTSAGCSGAGRSSQAAAQPTPGASAPRAASSRPAAAQPPPAPAAPRAAGASAAAAAAAASGRAAPSATFHRTADGLNVVYLNRQAAQPSDAGGSGKGGGKGKGGSVNSGWGNNFVRIDLKKGRGSTKYTTKAGSKRRKKGGGRFNSRWQASRLRQVGDGADFMEGWQGSKMRCFKCGNTGHMARECTAEQQAQADMGALLSGSEGEGSSGEEEGGQGGSLAGGGSSRGSGGGRGTQQGASAGWQPGPAGSMGRSLSGPASQPLSLPPAVDPAEEHAGVLAEPSQEALNGVLQSVFGHAAFRGLQLPTVQRLLGGESLLSIMPTGMGKSLCYQLPAALLPGLTLVVSPLIALMHDQAASVPPPLTAAVLWSGQRRAEAQQVLSDVAGGRVKILFVSPERLNNPHLLEALSGRMPLPLVVVDEAHCVAEWGHSFRPAYFRLGQALAGVVRAERVLALTATATRATEAAICQVLRISAGSVLRDAAVRQNLRLQVVRTAGGGSSQGTRDRITALFAPGGPLASVRSAIVYCAFKEDANQLARLLGVRGVTARAYHAGKDYRERSAVEADFAAGRVRVVAATVAFGMGINLSGVGAVVHATMPRSLEEYVQQIGRAGRDGAEARCVALLDDGDFVRLRSLAYSGVLDLQAVRGLLQAIFSPAAQGQRVPRGGRAAKGKGKGKGREQPAAAAAEGGRASKRRRKAAAAVAEEEEEEAAAELEAVAEAAAGGEEACPPRRFGVLALRKLGAELDMREESIEAVLSYLEAEEEEEGEAAEKEQQQQREAMEEAGEDEERQGGSQGPGPPLRMLPTTALSVKVSFYAATPEQLAEQHPVVQHVLEACPNPRNGLYSAPAARLAAAAQKAPGLVLQELRDLAAGRLIGFELSSEEGPAYEILHTPADLPALARRIHARLAAVLSCQVSRLDCSYRAMSAALRAGQAAAAGDGQAAAQEAALREAVERYFDGQQETAGSWGGGAGAAGDEEGQAAAGPASAPAPAKQQGGAWPPLLDTASLSLKPAGERLLGAARAALRSNREQGGPALSGRALARILHGVASPAFPSDPWQKRMGAFWGSQTTVDFAAVLRAAEIVARGEDQGQRQRGAAEDEEEVE